MNNVDTCCQTTRVSFTTVAMPTVAMPTVAAGDKNGKKGFLIYDQDIKSHGIFVIRPLHGEFT